MATLGAIGAAMAMIGFITSILDMMMNGAQYARWAPWGLGVAIVGVIFVSLAGG